MIPSDHFVRFYNEVFKFLDEKNDLQKYYDVIGRHQADQLLDLFRAKGLQGVHEYYEKIYREENCEGENKYENGMVTLLMSKCPSLSKALNNDAGACKKYCLHCFGWTSYVYTLAGLYQVYDQMGLDEPKCCEYIFDNKEAAQKKYNELLKTCPAENLRKNF